MLRQGKITPRPARAAVKAPIGLDLHPSTQGCVAAKTAPYFCDYVQRLILNDPDSGPRSGAEEAPVQGGLTIRPP